MELVCFTGFLGHHIVCFLNFSHLHDIGVYLINLRLLIINLIINLALKLVNNKIWQGSKHNINKANDTTFLQQNLSDKLLMEGKKNDVSGKSK